MATRHIPFIGISNSIVGNLRLTDSVIQDISQDDCIQTISNYLQDDDNKIEQLSSYIMLAQTALDDLSAKAVLHQLNSMSFLKAPADEPTNLCVQLYADGDLSSVISLDINGNPSQIGTIAMVFDSAVLSNQQFIEALLVNNQENDSGSSVEEIDNESGTNPQPRFQGMHGTQWMHPISSDGFGEEYNNAPVVLHLIDWMMNNEAMAKWVSTFTKDTQIYAKYTWYYELSGVRHASDAYSMVVPAQAEQTAPRPSNYGQPASSGHTMSTVQWANSNVIAQEAYDIESNSVAILGSTLDSNHDTICLKNYTEATEYRIRFTTGNATTTIGGSSGAISVYGSMTLLEDLNSVNLSANTTYLISIQAGMISILAHT